MPANNIAGILFEFSFFRLRVMRYFLNRKARKAGAESAEDVIGNLDLTPTNTLRPLRSLCVLCGLALSVNELFSDLSASFEIAFTTNAQICKGQSCNHWFF